MPVPPPTTGVPLDLLLWVFVYVATGTVSPTLVDYLSHTGGAGDTIMLVPVLCTALGMAMVGPFNTAVAKLVDQLATSSSSSSTTLVERQAAAALAGGADLPTPTSARSDAEPSLREALVARWPLAALDLASTSLVTIGLVDVGSATYTVIYSSAVAWTALIYSSRGKKLARAQIVGIVCVTCGLVLNGLGHATEDDSRGEASLLVFLAACACLLVGTISHSFVMILIDEASAGASASASASTSTSTSAGPSSAPDRPAFSAAARPQTTDNRPHHGSLDVATHMGSSEVLMLLAWNALLRVLGAGRAPPLRALPLLAALAANQMLHAVALFSMIGRLGAVGSAVLKGFLALCVFGLAAALFCDSAHSEQCLTPLKSISMVFVFVGGVVFGYASRKASRHAAGGGGASARSPKSGGAASFFAGLGLSPVGPKQLSV